MQHSAVDLENYARLYVADRLRDAARQRQASEVETGSTWLQRALARVQSWFTAAPRMPASPAPGESPRVELAPVAKRPRAASADPYAGMMVIARGKESCTLDAA